MATTDLSPTSFAPLGCFIGIALLLISAVAIARTRSGAGLLALAMLVGACATWPALRSGKPLVSDADALLVFRQVHANIYQSFARRTEESIYDALALSTEGELLRKIYLEVRRGLAMEDQGGAAARIRDVEIMETHRISNSQDDPASLRVRCRWNVSGTVEHWGHLHQRTNQYDAEFVVTPVKGCWKLVEMELLDEQRVSSETTLRSL